MIFNGNFESTRWILLRVTWVASLFRGSLPGNSFVTCNNTAGVARQPLHVTMEIRLEDVFYVVRPDAMSLQLPVTSYQQQLRTRYSWVQFSSRSWLIVTVRFIEEANSVQTSSRVVRRLYFCAIFGVCSYGCQYTSSICNSERQGIETAASLY
jgi:hypothetical protein